MNYYATAKHSLLTGLKIGLVVGGGTCNLDFDMKAYWANNADPDWQMLVFAENIKEAKKLAFKHMPMWGVDWVDVRVWLADQKWMKFYEGSDVIYSMPDMGDETWNQWLERFEAEHEQVQFSKT